MKRPFRLSGNAPNGLFGEAFQLPTVLKFTENSMVLGSGCRELWHAFSVYVGFHDFGV